MKRLKKWLARMMGGGKRQHQRWVLDVNRLPSEGDMAELLRRFTPVISRREYAKPPERLQRLFVQVGGKQK